MTAKDFKQIFPLGEKNDAYAQYFCWTELPVHADNGKSWNCKCNF